MSEVDKKGFLGGTPPVVERSLLYWECMEVLKSVFYANNFTHFWVDRAEELQKLMRSKAPDIVRDWYRYQIDKFTLTFSFSDDAIHQYQPIMREFSSFGAAVKILGIYENYFRIVIEKTRDALPDLVNNFCANHKKENAKSNNVKSMMSKALYRGIVFAEEIFQYKPHISYKPCINFFFEMRNITVHNLNKADEKMCEAAKSEFINLNKELRIGDTVEWSLLPVLQLNQFILKILNEVDTVVCTQLHLKTMQGKVYWYYEDTKK